jgi:hypothetical protein
MISSHSGLADTTSIDSAAVAHATDDFTISSARWLKDVRYAAAGRPQSAFPRCVGRHHDDERRIEQASRGRHLSPLMWVKPMSTNTMSGVLAQQCNGLGAVTD